MFKFLRVPAFTKLFDGRTTQSTDASDGTQVHSDVQYVPLAPEAEAEVERLQEEMGFDDQYEKPEGRTGDALAQVVAIIFGLITMSILVAQIILGGGTVWFNGRLFGGNPRAKFVWKYHRAVGYVTFLTLLLTAHLGGAWSDWSKEHSAYISRIFAYTLAPACLIAAVYSRVVKDELLLIVTADLSFVKPALILVQVGVVYVNGHIGDWAQVRPVYS
ncbi:hypothetical protein EW026_g1026 [Hermanssonia centrifuga]|uniref:Cytochrome b561 domain-containing protein n=1 Tax=Hermanssonia centrifuga TaxID=98765 RepID=A0A4S4KST9_9APHY|nr:hypothetical protein EW026_g1026 [Hermanssonia centrifuga]